jgi:hypothetical protein
MQLMKYSREMERGLAIVASFLLGERFLILPQYTSAAAICQMMGCSYFEGEVEMETRCYRRGMI